MYELDCWKGTVLKAAHRMIAMSSEFMQVLLLRPGQAWMCTRKHL